MHDIDQDCQPAILQQDRSAPAEAAASLSVPPSQIRFNRNVLILLACAVVLFIPPNFTGARDQPMLSTFNLDEALEYVTVMQQMTTRGSSIAETAMNMFFYDQYPYGYAFFFISALPVIPVKIFSKFMVSSNPVALEMLLVRQLSPLFMSGAILVLVYLWTEFRSLWRSVFLLLYLGFIPAVFANNMLWHPDSLATLFVVLTIFSLAKDDLRFGKWFCAAAVFCGLATGTKWLGQFFFLTIAVYLMLGWLNRGIALRRVVWYGIRFVLLMVVGTIVANPVLLVPTEAMHMWEWLKLQAAWNATGWIGTGRPVPLADRPAAWYTKALQEDFGFWWIGALALGVCLLGIFWDRRKWLLNVIILTWALPTSVYIILAVALPMGRYFIPILLPLLSCLGSPTIWSTGCRLVHVRTVRLAGAALTAVLCAVQFAYYTGNNLTQYTVTLTRETNNPAMKFYRELERAYLATLPENSDLDVLCDSYIYIRPSEHVKPRNSRYWSMDHRDLEPMPDLIVLRKFYIDEFSDPGVIHKEYDQQQAQRSHEYYRDAKNDSFRGFHKVFETDYGAVFAKDK